jgi:predicted amidohydrolase
MKLSLAQFEVTRADAEANLSKIAELAAQASANGSDLLCLPEMSTTGFDWAYNRANLNNTATQIDSVAQIAKVQSISICGSFLEKTESSNAANCFHYIDAAGAIIARYRKLHLFTLFREDKHVEAGNESVTFAAEHGKFGASICYDLRFPELFRKNTESGAVLHFLPAAFPHPRLEHWQTLIRARAIENQCYFVATNQCGVEGHGSSVGQTQYFGHSMVVDPWGEVIAEAGEEEALIDVEIDLSIVPKVRSKLSAWDDRRTDLF